VEPERWRRVADIFHAALEQPAATRDAYLDRACGGDAALRADVASLLARHRPDDGFLETPAAALPDPLAEDTLVAGQRLGPYTIEREIGRGGMGRVYLAHDTRLGRRVAVKALAPESVADPARRERLRREARAAAALSHPGIATVHALEELDGQLVIVGEYVDGETLRTEVSRGPLPVGRLVETALAIASALAAAHEQGVVHRDLKPENVIRSRSGAVKILDFGVARLARPQEGLLDTQLTERGALVGTPAYMSPEQLRGEAVDVRTDIFSFGTMLYELATGVHPFAGHDPVSTIARILDAAPAPLAERRPLAPPRLGTIVERALRKRSGERYTTTHELVADLERLRRDVEATADAAGPPVLPGRAPGAAARTPRWWWQFHQAVVGVAVLGLLVPLWQVRGWMPDAWDPALFFAALAAALVAAPLRFHLAFSARYYPDELAAYRRRVRPWIARVDLLFWLVLATTAWLLVPAHNASAALLFGAAVALAVTALVIEPVTTRAAFRGSAAGEIAGD